MSNTASKSESGDDGQRKSPTNSTRWLLPNLAPVPADSPAPHAFRQWRQIALLKRQWRTHGMRARADDGIKQISNTHELNVREDDPSAPLELRALQGAIAMHHASVDRRMHLMKEVRDFLMSFKCSSSGSTTLVSMLGEFIVCRPAALGS